MSFMKPPSRFSALRGTGSGFCFNTGRYLAAAGPYVVGHALGAATTPSEAIKWVAIVPLLGFLLTPFVVETHGLAPELRSRDERDT